MEYQILCVDHGIFPHGGSKIIRFGIRAGATIEVIPKENLLGRMARGEKFFVHRAGRKTYLTTAVSSQGNTFVETHGDDTLLDNLMALPICTINDRITYGTGVSDPNDIDPGFDGGDYEPPGGGGGDDDDD